MGNTLLGLGTDRVGESVTQMNTCVSKSNSGKGAGLEHLGASFLVSWIEDRPTEVLTNDSECFLAPHVTDRVGSLIDRTYFGPSRTRRSLIERQGSEAFKSVTEDIESGVNGHVAGHAHHIQRVDDGEVRFDASQSDSCFALVFRQIHYGGGGGFGPSSSRGRDRDQWKHRVLRLQRLSKRRSDKVQELGFWVGGVESGHLGRVYDGSSSDGNEAVETFRLGKLDRLHHALVSGFNEHIFKHFVVNVHILQSLFGIPGGLFLWAEESRLT